MVMKRNAMRKNLRQSIKKSFGRYIAIAAIISLGAGLFLGLLMTKTDMVATGQKFTDEQNMFDLRILSNYGWTEEYVEKFSHLEGVTDAEGIVSMDLIAQKGAEEEEAVYRFYSIPEKINKVALRGGRMPENPDECLADGFLAGEQILGSKVLISDNNEEDSLDALKVRTFTVVGYVASPLYMDMNRGTTSVGSGSISSYFYIPADAFDLDYYTEIDLTIAGDYPIYTDAFNDALDAAADELEPEAERMNMQRFQDIKSEAEQEYSDGYWKYLDGLMDYRESKADAEKELADAEKELTDGEKELEDSRKQLLSAETQIEYGRTQLASAREQLRASREQYNANKALADQTIPAKRAELNGILDAFAGREYDQLTDEEKAIYDAAQGGLNALDAQEAALNSAGAQIEAAAGAIRAQDKELDGAEYTLAVNWAKWKRAKQEIADGWGEFFNAKAEAHENFSRAETKLSDAKAKLVDARQEIDEMDEPELHILDRNSNVGFVNLDSNSDIVAGVSRVFPVFFLLIASLVCITTMTRMIDEERTQIGTLKALGYSNAAIISKYMLYSGSGALLGCGVGILLGATVFLSILWQAYCIMLYIQPNVVLTVDWPLCIAIVLVYLGAMLFVTWYCCHKTLEEEPANLIRPKSPDAGKKIFLEIFPFWKKISFLNKVTIRNIFRYRQRLAMMLVGIGGCTALLVTGFGLKDSIVNIMDYQFQNITHYDLSVYFREENTELQEAEFLDAVGSEGVETMFFHQSNVEIDFDNQVKDIYMISAGEQLTDFITMRRKEQEVNMPGIDEALLSVGVAEAMGIRQGDTIVLRNTEMQTMELTVSGIYDNHVYNYVIVLPETIEAGWGELPEKQMAFVKTGEAVNNYTVSARISGLGNVMNVSVSEDVANMVRGMMDALDLVVMVVILCAGLLAVTVLYNLTNININERIREIATIKVLGFNYSETAAYVFKENMALTVAGSILGLVFGKLLLIFVMSQIKIDMVWFKAVAKPTSFIWAISLTLLSAIAVNLIFARKLETINMAEALKSVE